ncbi:hypothetical protein [Muricoccus vinaceus]|uniref:Uncharacterized protein n=1 Tax=Muricoccus vinaceus TaxID=424704 RepID=A0ABV6IX26_9PROT
MEAESEQQDPSRNGSVDDSLEQVINTAKYLADFARNQHLDEADALLTEILIILFAGRNRTFQ